jgi:elongator complex protein 3
MEIEDLISETSSAASGSSGEGDLSGYVRVVGELVEKIGDASIAKEVFDDYLLTALKKHGMKMVPSKRKLGMAYKQFLATTGTAVNEELQAFLVHKSVRSSSGILNVSVSLPPDKFSCRYNCYFCPNEPGMPRSYLSNEAVFTRAAQVGFDTVKQVWRRLESLEKSGHTLDKIEYRVLGGTFSCYDHEVADAYIRDLYYAANTYYSRHASEKRVVGSIEEEQALNVTAAIHVVGLGVETRPDEITPAEIIRFRRYGITRVETGVQHTDDALLRRVNRGHGVAKSRAAIKLLKDYGFKVEIHIMADLPGATPEGDMECYRQVLQADSGLIPDYMKDYPCLDVDFSVLKEWKKDGRWQPYAERTPDARELKEVLVYRQEITPKWVRVNRIHRDFQEARVAVPVLVTAQDQEARAPVPAGCGAVIGFSSESIKTNFAQIVKREAESRGIYCKCIRCCELRDEKFRLEDVVYETAGFDASEGYEYFMSAEIKKPTGAGHVLLGFIRLRLSDALEESIIPELKGKTAMIRELHVYGSLKAVGRGGAGRGAQHLGIGRTLLQMAEERAQRHGYEQMAVISGIGVRGYYEKNGYTLRGTYMMKDIREYVPWWRIFITSDLWIDALIVMTTFCLLGVYVWAWTFSSAL